METPLEQEDIDNIIIVCEKCNCSNIALTKRGFRIEWSIIGFFIGLIVCAMAWSNADHPDRLTLSILYLTYTFPVVGILGGTLGMNEFFSICLNCGNSRKLPKTSNTV